MSNDAFRRRDIWVEDNDIESAIRALRRQSRDVLYELKHRRLRGPKPSDKRRDKLWFAYRSRNVARAAEARWRAAERQRTLIAAWEGALERRRSGSGPA